jgi:hypothetical protein
MRNTVSVHLKGLEALILSHQLALFILYLAFPVFFSPQYTSLF